MFGTPTGLQDRYGVPPGFYGSNIGAAEWAGIGSGLIDAPGQGLTMGGFLDTGGLGDPTGGGGGGGIDIGSLGDIGPIGGSGGGGGSDSGPINLPGVQGGPQQVPSSPGPGASASDWAKWLKIAVPVLGAVAGGVFGGSKQLKISSPSPIYPGLQKAFGNWLLSNVGQTVQPYGQPLSPDLSKTMLPNVWSGYNNISPQGIHNDVANLWERGMQPITNQLQSWGGPAGPGTNAQSLMMQYGSPSQVGQYLSNVAQFGTASPGSGQPLTNWANITPQMASQFLLPYAQGGKAATAYTPPRI